VLGTPSRRQDDYDERGIASSDKGKLHRAAQGLGSSAHIGAISHGAVTSVLGALSRRHRILASAASLQAARASHFEPPKSFQLKRLHRRILP